MSGGHFTTMSSSDLLTKTEETAKDGPVVHRGHEHKASKQRPTYAGEPTQGAETQGAETRGDDIDDEKGATQWKDTKKKVPFGMPRKGRNVQCGVLFDSDTGKIDGDGNADGDMALDSRLAPSRNTPPRPRPPIDLSMPGAYREGEVSSDSFSSTDRPTTDTPEADHPVLVTAEMVDEDEEEERIRQLEEQNRQFRERENDAAYATVLGKGEILKSFFNLRDPEFRRQRICGFGFLILIVAGVTVGLVLTRKGPPSGPITPAPMPAPTPAPTSLLHGSLSGFLADISLDDGAALFDQSTPQFQAVQWLANDTNLDNYIDKQKIQRYALATFYFSTQGANWEKNDLWLSDSSECQWFEVDCTSQDEVTRLDLSSNGLNGTIPPEIALLSTSLERIDFQENNDLAGTVPTEFQFLTLLRTLDLDEDSLGGALMTELGLLTNLNFLRMGGNDFSGTIPTELFLLTNLVTLRLGNNLNGTIPSIIGRLTSLGTCRPDFC